jgi:ribosomal protein L28
MELDLEAIIESAPDNTIDMKSGLNTLEGISDLSSYVVEAILTDELRDKQVSNRSVKTFLKHRFRGSYGQAFFIRVSGEELKKKMDELGKTAIYEIIRYFIAEALYADTPTLSPRAKAKLKELEKISDDIVTKIRNSSLEKIHKIPNSTNHSVKLGYRRNRNSYTLGTFNENTAGILKVTKDNTKIELDVIINRFNSFTGNGRMVVKGTVETVAFGFDGNYQLVKTASKKKISANLNKNTGIQNEEERKYIKLEAASIKRKDGKIIKYLIQGFPNNEA